MFKILSVFSSRQKRRIARMKLNKFEKREKDLWGYWKKIFFSNGFFGLCPRDIAPQAISLPLSPLSPFLSTLPLSLFLTLCLPLSLSQHAGDAKRSRISSMSFKRFVSPIYFFLFLSLSYSISLTFSFSLPFSNIGMLCLSIHSLNPTHHSL